MSAARAAARIHRMQCRCARCRPAAARLSANAIAARAIAGLALGQLAVIAIDALAGGPGPFALFGL